MSLAQLKAVWRDMSEAQWRSVVNSYHLSMACYHVEVPQSELQVLLEVLLERGLDA